MEKLVQKIVTREQSYNSKVMLVNKLVKQQNELKYDVVVLEKNLSAVELRNETVKEKAAELDTLNEDELLEELELVNEKHKTVEIVYENLIENIYFLTTEGKEINNMRNTGYSYTPQDTMYPMETNYGTKMDFEREFVKDYKAKLAVLGQKLKNEFLTV